MRTRFTAEFYDESNESESTKMREE